MSTHKKTENKERDNGGGEGAHAAKNKKADAPSVAITCTWPGHVDEEFAEKLREDLGTHVETFLTHRLGVKTAEVSVE